MFTQDFINKIKQRVNLIELASEYTMLEKAGSNLYQGRCPNPSHKDSSPSFRVWTDGKYHSWACMGCHCGSKNIKNKEATYKNYGSDCIAFYQWINEVSFKQAVLDLCKKYSIQIPNSEFDKLYKKKKLQTKCFQKNLYSYPRNFLHERGLSDSDIDEWQIGFDGLKITFPLFDRYKCPIAFTKRWITVPEGRNDKYKNSATSKIFNKSYYFYGLHNLNESCEEIRITEGSMDVIMAHKYGAKNIVATLGTSFTDEHVEMIKKLGKVPVFIMDGDGPGIISATKAIEKLAEADIYSKILILPNNKDLCDIALDVKYGIEEYIQDNALTYGQHKLKDIINSYDSAINELKIKHLKKVRKILDCIPYEEEKIIMTGYIKKHFEIDY